MRLLARCNGFAMFTEADGGAIVYASRESLVDMLTFLACVALAAADGARPFLESSRCRDIWGRPVCLLDVAQRWCA